MTYRSIKIDDLLINSANDRHGELENETAAIAWLFNTNEAHMRNLAKDIAETGDIYEPPLVFPFGDKFVVYDGNRRTTCLKLIQHPKRAPTVELREFFEDIASKKAAEIPTVIQCQVETDRDRIDEILFRRHTGSQRGRGTKQLGRSDEGKLRQSNRTRNRA